MPAAKKKAQKKKTSPVKAIKKQVEKVLSSADMKSIEGVVKDLLTNLMKKPKKPKAAAKKAKTTRSKPAAKPVTKKKKKKTTR